MLSPVTIANHIVRLRLYIVSSTPNSVLAERNLLVALCEINDRGARLGLEIVDIAKDPKRGVADGVIVTPTLMAIRSDGPLFMIGDLRDKAKLELLLQTLRDEQTIGEMTALVAEKNEALAEKAVTAEELNHRIKNHLHLLHGMLAEHLTMVSGTDEKASVDGIIRRVITLAAIYEQLLGTGFSNMVDLGSYLQTLCDNLPDMQPNRKEAVTLNCDAESLLVDLETVTIIGMVVAETIANSYKHAFSVAGGKIDVSLRRSKQAEAMVIVSDDGPGFTEQVGSGRHGVGLLRRMMQRVDGNADLSTVKGTSWSFRFPVSSIA